MQDLWLPKCEALDVRVVLAGAALHNVGRQGEGRAHEAQHCALVAHLCPQRPQRLAHVRRGFLCSEPCDLIDLLHSQNDLCQQ